MKKFWFAGIVSAFLLFNQATTYAADQVIPHDSWPPEGHVAVSSTENLVIPIPAKNTKHIAREENYFSGKEIAEILILAGRNDPYFFAIRITSDYSFKSKHGAPLKFLLSISSVSILEPSWAKICFITEIVPTNRYQSITFKKVTETKGCALEPTIERNL